MTGKETLLTEVVSVGLSRVTNGDTLGYEATGAMAAVGYLMV